MTDTEYVSSLLDEINIKNYLNNALHKKYTLRTYISKKNNENSCFNAVLFSYIIHTFSICTNETCRAMVFSC